MPLTCKCGALLGYMGRSAAARYLGVSYDKLEKDYTRGRGPACRKVDGTWLYAVADLDAYALQRAPAKAEGEQPPAPAPAETGR